MERKGKEKDTTPTEACGSWQRLKVHPDTQGYALGQCVLQGAVTHRAKPGISMQDDSPVELILEVHLRFIG